MGEIWFFAIRNRQNTPLTYHNTPKEYIHAPFILPDEETSSSSWEGSLIPNALTLCNNIVSYL